MNTDPQSPQGSPSEARGSQSPSDADLKPYGWAPGGYLSVCGDCGRAHDFSDKRSARCRPCAEKLYAADHAPSPSAGAEGRQSPGLEEALATVRRLVAEVDGDKGARKRAAEIMVPMLVLRALAATPSQEEGPAGVDCPTCGLPANADRNPTPWAYQQACRAIDAHRRRLVVAEKGWADALRAQAPASSPRDLEAIRQAAMELIAKAMELGEAHVLKAEAIYPLADEVDTIREKMLAMLAAHPPKGETPALGPVDFDFALLEDTIDLAYNTSAEEDEERANAAKGVLADIKSALNAPGTPIEKAAREALEKINQAIDALMVVAMNSRDKDGIVYLLRAARASLSSLPQEPAGGWYDPAHDCEDHCTMCQGLKARRAAQEGAAGEGGAG